MIKFNLGVWLWTCPLFNRCFRAQTIYYFRHVSEFQYALSFKKSQVLLKSPKFWTENAYSESLNALRYKNFGTNFKKKNHFGTRYPFRRVKVTWSYILKINSRDQNCFGMYIICSICHHVTSFFTDQKSHLRAGIHAPEPAGARVSHQLAPTGARTKRYMDPCLRVLFVPSKLLF